MLAVGHVDGAVGVGLHAVTGGALVALVADGDGVVVVEPAIHEGVGGHPPQPPAGQGAVDPAAVGRDGDAVGAHAHGLGVTVGRALHEGPASTTGEVGGQLRLGAGVVVQPAPRLAGGQVDDDQAVGALVRLSRRARHTSAP